MDVIRFIRSLRPRRLQKLAFKAYLKHREASWRDRPLPDFLVIGAQKSGTTSLHSYLCQHPQLFPSPFKKEVFFFDGGRNKSADSFIRGESWYRAHFPRRREVGDDARIFETATHYVFHPLAPGRIFNLAPKTKLIALLRNPAKRAISHYLASTRKNFESLPMLEAFQREEARLEPVFKGRDYKNDAFIHFTYKSRGRYKEQLDRYLEFFPAHQILLINSEELFNNPHESLKRVFNFVGVDAGFAVSDVTPRNVGGNKVDVPSSVREYLDDYFRPHNHALYEQTGRDFGW